MTAPKEPNERGTAMTAAWFADGITGYDIGARCKSTFQKDEAYQWLVDHIKQAMEQAREEASRICDHSPCDECMDKFESKGFSAAQEKAAKIAEKRVVHNPQIEYDSGWNRGAHLISMEIRAMKPEAEGGCPEALIDCKIKGPHRHDIGRETNA